MITKMLFNTVYIGASGRTASLGSCWRVSGGNYTRPWLLKPSLGRFQNPRRILGLRDWLVGRGWLPGLARCDEFGWRGSTLLSVVWGGRGRNYGVTTSLGLWMRDVRAGRPTLSRYHIPVTYASNKGGCWIHCSRLCMWYYIYISNAHLLAYFNYYIINWDM